MLKRQFTFVLLQREGERNNNEGAIVIDDLTVTSRAFQQQ